MHLVICVLGYMYLVRCAGFRSNSCIQFGPMHPRKMMPESRVSKRKWNNCSKKKKESGTLNNQRCRPLGTKPGLNESNW